MFGSPADLYFNIIICKQFYEVLFDRLDLDFAVWPGFLQLFSNFFIFFRVDVAKAQILKLPLDLPDTKPVGERSKDIEGLFCDSLALGLWHEAQSTHIMQTVCQFDEHDADIIAHGQKGLAQGF